MVIHTSDEHVEDLSHTKHMYMLQTTPNTQTSTCHPKDPTPQSQKSVVVYQVSCESFFWGTCWTGWLSTKVLSQGTQEGIRKQTNFLLSNMQPTTSMVGLLHLWLMATSIFTIDALWMSGTSGPRRTLYLSRMKNFCNQKIHMSIPCPFDALLIHHILSFYSLLSVFTCFPPSCNPLNPLRIFWIYMYLHPLPQQIIAMSCICI